MDSDPHGILTGHAVGYEEDLIGMHSILHADQLAHHLFVDLQAPGGIENDHAVAGALSFLDPRLGDPDHVLRGPVGIDWHTELRA